MMKVVFQILFVFCFPTFIYGLECGVIGKCYGFGANNSNFDYDTKKCDNTCVYFKCLVPDSKNASEIVVMEGAGCYEDFINVCKWIPTKYKDEIKEDLWEFSITTEELIFQSCSDKNECIAIKEIEDTVPNKEIFGSKIDTLQYPRNVICQYDDAPKKIISMPKCSRMIICEPAGLYERETPEDQDFGADKECEACFDFICTNNGGNTVIEGNGCFEDFVHACPTVPNSVKRSIKNNIKDSFYFDDNYIVTSCSDKETIVNCDNKYISNNYWVKEKFYANLNTSYMEYCPATLLRP